MTKDELGKKKVFASEVRKLRVRKTYRPQHQIIKEILQLAESGQAKTYISMRAGLAEHQKEIYFPELLKMGLLEEVNGRYVTTSKGRDAIEKISKADNMIPKIGE